GALRSSFFRCGLLGGGSLRSSFSRSGLFRYCLLGGSLFRSSLSCSSLSCRGFLSGCFLSGCFLSGCFLSSRFLSSRFLCGGFPSGCLFGGTSFPCLPLGGLLRFCRRGFHCLLGAGGGRRDFSSLSRRLLLTFYCHVSPSNLCTAAQTHIPNHAKVDQRELMLFSSGKWGCLCHH